MALALDSSAHSVDATPVTLSTSSANDVIILLVATNGGPILSVTSPNLTFSFRKTNNLAGSSYPEECWYAIASSPLSSEVITVTPTTAGTFQDLIAFGVSGANLAAPFDANGPYGISAGPTDLSVATSVADTLIFGGYRFATTGAPTSGSGFAQIAMGSALYHLVEWKIVSSTQSSLDLTIGTGAGDQNGGVGDAIVVASVGSVFLLPDGEISTGGWTTDAGGTDLHTAIDESTASDADYIKSALTPSNDVCEVSLSNPSGTLTTPFAVHYRYRKNGARPIDLTVELRQGSSTSIASWTHSAITDTILQADQTLTGGQAASISDQTDLRLRFTANAP